MTQENETKQGGGNSALPDSPCSARMDHLQWCKARALEYVDAGDMNQAYASMVSDLGKEPETAGHDGIQLGMMLLMGGHLSSESQMRDFINGFN